MTTGYEPDFDIDVQYGEQGELMVGELFKQLLNGHASKEVKRERYRNESLYVECWQRPAWRGTETEFPWKPSGLSTTKADYYVFQKPGGIMFAVPTELLKEVIRRGLGKSVNTNRGDNPTRGYLIRVGDIFPIGEDEHP